MRHFYIRGGLQLMEIGSETVEVWDTSVPIHNPLELEHFLEPDYFKGEKIVFPSIVIKELTGLKKRQDIVGANARTTLNILERLKDNDKLSNDQENISSRVTIRYKMAGPEKLPAGFDPSGADEQIVRVAIALRDEGHRAVLVSNDVDVRLMGFACNLETKDFSKDINIEKIEDLYAGTAHLEVEHAENIQTLFDSKVIPVTALISNKKQLQALLPNQCCYLATTRNGKDKIYLALYKKTKDKEPFLRLVNKPKIDNLRTENAEIMPRNAEQAFAYDMLCDPDIHLVTISGKARTGKTLTALLAGYEQLEKRYEMISVYRPVIEMGHKDLGYLPGTLDDKFAPYAVPIIKNFNLILNAKRGFKTSTISRRKHENSDKKEMSSAKDFIEHDLLEISPPNFVLGDTWMNQFVIIDEAQNLQPSEIKMLVSRTSFGTKIVITGDPNQIFHPHCDALSNGLVHAIEHTKGEDFFGHIKMVKGEGHMLAEFAADNY